MIRTVSKIFNQAPYPII